MTSFSRHSRSPLQVNRSVLRTSFPDIASSSRVAIERAFVSLERQTRHLRTLPSKGWLSPFILPGGKRYVKRLTTGFAVVVSSMVWSTSMPSCVTQAIPRNCFLNTTAETICIPIMQVASPREMPFPLHCSQDDGQLQLLAHGRGRSYHV